MKDTEIYEKSVYLNYPSSTIKSNSEVLFEEYCNQSDFVKWYYKNGEKSPNYFSLVYVDAINHKWHFYPDYILCDKDDNVWIIEAKGGENKNNQSKNIDLKAENKFAALKEYATKNKIKWGFVRDYEKNNKLYFSNTEYVEDLKSDCWIALNKIFK